MKNLAQLIAFALIAIIITNGCKQSTTTDAEINLTEQQQNDIAEGFNIMQTSCFSCHSPQPTMKDQLAPPMVAIKAHYLDNETSFDEFAKDLSSYVVNPDSATSKMPGAIKKFGIMPKMNYSQEQLNQVATYLFYTEIEAPDWFEKHFKEEQKQHRKRRRQGNNNIDFLAEGKNFAMSTKSILGKNLLGAIKSKGTAQAVEFCNTKAIPLTDSMAHALNAHIKRVSDLPRNPNNKATGAALDYINKGKKLLANGEPIKPHLLDIDGKKIGFYPIMTNEMCMQCHGAKNEQIDLQTLNAIAKLYPNDLAMGYKTDELRGIWLVEMDARP
ncbi:MAG: Tll0287-like domain-containing protein [Bacteroidia bacterium]